MENLRKRNWLSWETFLWFVLVLQFAFLCWGNLFRLQNLINFDSSTFYSATIEMSKQHSLS